MIFYSMLVGEGARQWAVSKNLEEVDDNYHKTGIFQHLSKLIKKIKDLK